MKLFVLGATGRTGHQFVDQAIEHGHHVTAFVREQKKLIPTPQLEIIEGDVSDSSALTDALKGHDAVISCLGTDLSDADFLASVTDALVPAMKANDVTRILYLASAGIDKEIPGIAGTVVTFMLRKPLRDHRAAVDLWRNSSFDYTIVRPMQLTDGPRTSVYRTDIDGIPADGKQISRADVAQFMLNTVEENSFVRQSIGLAY
ncbi:MULTISPECIES: NAD(P)-dependent oxidoreductase [unclassified Exiguobacterium]|uniref:NAD(P)-dependent oxidoreductase n=1 Tax=unclassified Exiguobacterium TaxID=2644629 RepID=UPI0010387057|nr:MULTISPECIES: NAD(P)-binding oxidoreductase [unclassified Exiguobacterium]TCI44304.1 NAD(P)-dependent oxidoreductase [Exiguobacterium sp. SH5S32]TCI50568.1 NAD(P)-dependent oxidoreductase [Exiguobacterium sp. SH1S4]TCI69528.1 NAD(P)-dependent oxidoreductase [Exiguobacterium sp. SH1S1]